MSDTASFGRQALTASSPSAFIALEQELGKDDRFPDVDDLIGHLVDRALQGGRVAALVRDRRGDTVSITGLDAARRGVLDERFVLTNQRERGAWFIPEKAALKVGLLGFPATFATYPRFASGIVWEERARADFTRSAAAVLMWSVLEPLFEQLYIPFELRGRLVGMKSRDDQLASWAALDDLLAALRIDVADELAVMRYGGGWGRLRGADQLAAKQRVLAALAAQSTPELALLYRAHRLRPLIARYYEKAKGGKAPRKQVVTRSLERTPLRLLRRRLARFLALHRRGTPPGRANRHRDPRDEALRRWADEDCSGDRRREGTVNPRGGARTRDILVHQ